MKSIELFAGAGGSGIGLEGGGFESVWANDINSDACQSYFNNVNESIQCGDIRDYSKVLESFRGSVDLLAGGPPCQGFSKAGKQDIYDARSKHIWTFLKSLEILSPNSFIMENVTGLINSKKFKGFAFKLLKAMRKLGYAVGYTILTASDFNTPQNRKRVFFIGFKTNNQVVPDLDAMLDPYRLKARSVRDVLSVLDRAGKGNNMDYSKAKIILALRPDLGKTAYSSRLFNGFGRSLRLSGYSPTILGYSGNGLPVVDERELYDGKNNWSVRYRAGLKIGKSIPKNRLAPSYLRRLSVKEAQLLQTFPLDFKFSGSPTSKYTQIGNAVPCELAFRVASMVYDCLKTGRIKASVPILGQEDNSFEL